MTFLLLDGRSVLDPDDAEVMDTADSEDEARELGLKTWAGHDAVWHDDNGPRFDLPPFSVSTPKGGAR